MQIDFVHALSANLLSPAVLFFALGITAALIKSDLKFPEALYVTLTIYLLLALGFKGGVAIHEAGIRVVNLPALAAMLLGALIPLWTYPLLRFGGKLRPVDAAAIAAHYGSVSAVTFITATNYLKGINEPYENYATAFLAVMESPAIIVGVLLGKMTLQRGNSVCNGSFKSLLREAVFGRSVFLLLGALLVGSLCGKSGMEKVEPFFVTPFQGVLALFLLEMGMVASHTPLPVIGVPVESKSLKGMDSLLSIVQMPGGIPVATVAIGGARNAGLLAVSILAASNSGLLAKVLAFKKQLAAESRQRGRNLLANLVKSKK